MEPKPAQCDWSIVLRLQVWSHVYRLYIHMQISVLRVERRPIIANKVSALAVKFCHRFHINMHFIAKHVQTWRRITGSSINHLLITANEQNRRENCF